MNLRHVAASLLVAGSFAACGDGQKPMQDPSARYRIVQSVDGQWDGDVDLVFAHDDTVAFAAAEASKSKGRTGIQFVGIGGLPDQGLKWVVEGVLAASIEQPTGAEVAIDMALLACSGIAPPRRIAPRVHVYTKANLAAGGEVVPRPDEVVLDLLRRQHADVLTTQPTIDIVFRMGLVDNDGGDPWFAALRTELTAAAKRYPQIAFDCRPSVEELIAQNYNAILVAPKEGKVLAAACKEAMAHDIKVIVVGRELGSDDFTCFVGADPMQLGEVAGGQVARLLGPAGGTIVELQGPSTSHATQQRHAGFRKALGLKQP